MKVTLLSGLSPEVESAGGIRSYVESLSRYLRNVGIPCLNIVSGSAQRIGDEWCSIRVRKFGSTAHWLAALVVNLRSMPIAEDSIVHAQRPDDLLPFVLAGIGRVRVCTLHGNPLRAIIDRGSRAISAGYAITEAAVLRRTDRVVFVDSENASQYLRRYPWLDGRSEVIPNGVDTDLFRPSDRSEAKRKWGFDGTIFLYAGRLQPEKRVAEIVRAFGDLDRRDCSLVLVGDGRDRPLVEEAADGLRVRFLGTVPRSQMPSLMNASDALVLYSTREGLPSVVLEALACGIPVITTPVGAVAEVIRDSETGFLVTSKSELSKAMERVCQGEAADSSAISRTVRPYSWNELGPLVLKAYSRAVKSAEVDFPN
jgi:glycosyltransferase involved in cell wall biosynthesis